MSIVSSYIDTHIISIIGDYTHTLSPGMTVRTDCGTDGVRLVKVDKLEYKGGKTIIYTIPSESEDMTGNLQNVSFSCIKPASQNKTGNYGNIPADWLWMYRGFKRGITLSWYTWDRIDLSPGYVHYYDYSSTRETFAILESAVSFTGLLTAGYTANTWYYIYLNVLDSQTSIINPVSTAFTISSTAPTFDTTYFKWYHPTGGLNCIAFFQMHTPGTAGVLPFLYTPKIFFIHPRYAWNRTSTLWTGANQQNMNVDMPLTIPTSIKVLQNFNFLISFAYYAEVYWYNRAYGVTTNPNWMIRHTPSGIYNNTSSSNTSYFSPIDNSKLVTLIANADSTAGGQFFPAIKNQSRYFLLPIGFIET